MNLPTKIFIGTLLVAACSLLIAGVSIAVPILVELPRPIPLLITKPIPPSVAIFTPYRDTGRSYPSITTKDGTRQGAQPIPLQFNATVQPIPTQWKDATNVLINH